MGHAIDMFKRIIQNEALRKNNRKFSHFKNAAMLQAKSKAQGNNKPEHIFSDEQKIQMEQELQLHQKLEKRRVFIKIIISIVISSAFLVIISQILLWAFF